MKTFYFIVLRSFWWCTFWRDFSFHRSETILFILTCLLVCEAMLEYVYVKELIFPWWFDSHWFPPSKVPFVIFAWNTKLATHHMFSCLMMAPGKNVSSLKLSETLLTSTFYTLFLLCRRLLPQILWNLF